MRSSTRFFLIFVALVAISSTAYADVIGEAGTAAALKVHTPSADTYLQFHGQLTVKNAAGTFDIYRWGGTSCGSRTVSETQVASLQLVVGDKKTRLEPTYQIGQGDSRCLVGFNLVPKSLAKVLLP